ncbi:hypothetical protein [Anaeromyxobacter dehalogenans]|uniref:Uncharacterized protein n=1 Tax=Anaeromyxobacter dehalogenans (strain 2CP-C) TaxID=290397 RepID=Q2IJ10_ANADE|nr:hypothetical protein [Anaeromyxobacter dehalogenans]ABC81643.1 hypothetical protein Adeh_1872 [Anaeromyxobacter dehalogenans 2CP-C]
MENAIGAAGVAIGLVTLGFVVIEFWWAFKERKRREAVDARLRQIVEQLREAPREVDSAGLEVSRSDWDAVALGVRMGLLVTWWSANTIRVGAKRD